jgi:hypothetical protein
MLGNAGASRTEEPMNATNVAGYWAMLADVKAWPERVWEIEGCQGIGRHPANRLLADGEQVVDMPAKLSAGRGFAPQGSGARRLMRIRSRRLPPA